jgi:SnoaL-like domain
MHRILLFVFLFISIVTNQSYAAEFNSSESRQKLDKAVKDYIELYRADTLDQWKRLFDPSVIIVFPGDDGTVTVRNLEQFVERQKNYFATRKSISERLENVQIFEGRRIARLVADFIFVDEGQEFRGKLGLHLVEGSDDWKIVAVLFSYNSPK